MILSKFWSRYDLQNFREQKFLGGDQSELIRGTVQLCTHLNLVLLLLNLVRTNSSKSKESPYFEFVRNGPVLNVLKVITIYCPVYFILYQI